MNWINLAYKPMVQAGVHVGHFYKHWNLTSVMYLWGIRSGLHFFNLRFTLINLKKFLNFSLKLQQSRKLILVVNHRFYYGLPVEKTLSIPFKKLRQSYISSNWPIGLLTNQRIVFSKLIRKNFVGHPGLRYFNRAPSVLYILNYKDYWRNWPVAECYGAGIPSAALVDTNQSPFGVVYPIPSNNDSTLVLLFHLYLLIRSLRSGLVLNYIRVRRKLLKKWHLVIIKQKFKKK